VVFINIITVIAFVCLLYFLIYWGSVVACFGGTIGSISVRAAWLWWPTSLGSKLSLAGSLVSDCSGICFEIKLSGRHRGFNSVLFKLWPLDNTGFRGAQSLVPAWTSDNRWCTTAWSGRPLMALFARIAKLGSGAYGTRHARVRSSVMQCVLAVRETVV